MRLFDDDADYAAFERVLLESLEILPLRICAYCLMPNHWHFVVWPDKDDDLAPFMQLLSVTHVTRWQKHRHCVGSGHVYQGRYKSFPVETESYFYQLVRYVERNALRANLVIRAEDWRWGSAWRRLQTDPTLPPLLSDWPLPMPAEWSQFVNEPQTESEVQALRRCIHRNQPFGSAEWTHKVAKELNLESALRPRGRPRRNP